MTFEILNTAAAVGTFLVIAGTAIAALVQLRHLRRGNWLAVQLKILEMWSSDAIQEPYNYIKVELPEKLKDPKYRAELEYGPIDRSVHREMVMIDWNTHLGLILEEHALDDSFLGFYMPAIVVSWEKLAPVVALLRRGRDENTFQHFEYLVARARAYAARSRRDIFARGLQRPDVPDEWLAIDHPAAG